MSSPGGGGHNARLVRRAIDLTYENRQRASSLRWGVLNAALLLLFAYDLTCKCPGYTSALHYVELAAASALCASLLQHARCWLPPRAAALSLTRAQQRLLGLRTVDLDSSFRVVEAEGSGEGGGGAADVDCDAGSVSVSPAQARAWRPSPGTPAADSPPAPAAHRSPPPSPPADHFIADRDSLAHYLKQYEARSLQAGGAGGGATGTGAAAAGAYPAPLYQLAALDTERRALEEAGGGAAGGGAGSPHVWWRLHLDPQRLTQFNFNLRLWLQVTILERLVREMSEAEGALQRAGGAPHALGALSLERLRKLGAGGAGGAASLRALLPFLEPYPDQQYLVQRIRELSVGGCLSEYRWSGGGAAWDESKPTDAELVLHLFAAYMDVQLGGGVGGMGGAGGGGGGGAFSGAHVSRAPHAPRRPLGVHRAQPHHPPHYVLALGAADTLEVARGRNNLLHTLLLLLAACARDPPPPPSPLSRTNLGPAGLNMLWIIGR